MKIPCACQACGFVNDAEWSQIGQWIACRACGKTLVVPAPMETIGSAEPPKAVVKFRCPACNRKFATKAELAGKKIRCTGCGAGVRVPESEPIYWSDDDAPGPAQSGQSRAPKVSPPTYMGTDAVQAPPAPGLGRPPGVAAPTHYQADALPPPVPGRAPAAGVLRPSTPNGPDGPAPMLDELASLDRIKAVKHAGTVLTSRAEMMEHVRQKAAEENFAAHEKTKKTKKKKKKRRKKSGYFDAMETLKLVASVGAFVVVLALVAWGYPDFRFPVGGLLCVVGFIVYLLGITSLRQLVAEEGPFKALLFRFVPPYQWWYVATRWDETKDFVAFFGAGMLILSVGGAVIKTSPIGKKAEAADRAYQKAKQGTSAEISPPARVVGPSRKEIRTDIPPSSPNAEVGEDN
jgi:hypothetical protein